MFIEMRLLEEMMLKEYLLLSLKQSFHSIQKKNSRY
jgi:hypothetical protein